MKLVGVKIKNFLKNVYFLPIFTANHSIYMDLWILWSLYDFKRNLRGIYGVFRIFKVYGMCGMLSAFSLKCFSLCKEIFPKAFLLFLQFPYSILQNPCYILSKKLNYFQSACQERHQYFCGLILFYA